jgi:hypothetical protein
MTPMATLIRFAFMRGIPCERSDFTQERAVGKWSHSTSERMAGPCPQGRSRADAHEVRLHRAADSVVR